MSACTAGWCCGKTCLRNENRSVRDPRVGMCNECAKTLVATIRANALEEAAKLLDSSGAEEDRQAFACGMRSPTVSDQHAHAARVLDDCAIRIRALKEKT